MSTALAPGLARKLKKVLETRTDSPDLLLSLSTLSSFYSESTPQGRKNLHTTIERRGLSINEEFLRASEAAQNALDAVEREVAGLAECCDRITQSLNSCSATTGDIVAATERLKHDLEITNQRQDIVSSFLRDYQLSPEEVSALRDEELNDTFFKALARVQEIHANCKVLLRTHHQRAGLELMDMMAVYQEGAYERLCRWVQAECRSLGDNDTPEVSELLKRAARCLKERPVLFKYCAEEVANTRHNALFRRFISALTRGGPAGMPRPIEVHAHDPLRYVGDMLGWLHQALASERELAIGLFSPDASVGSMSRRFSADLETLSSEKPETDLGFVLDRVFEGVCRPFKVRVEQVLQSQPGLLLAYKLSHLLDFYRHTISEFLGQEAALSVTLRDVAGAAEKTFFDMLKGRGDKLLRYLPPVAVDLSPLPAVAEGIAALLELLTTYNRMMVSAGGKKPDFQPVVSAMLDPIIEMCERAADTYASKSTKPPLRRSATGMDSNRRLSSAGPLPQRTSSIDPFGSSNVVVSTQAVGSSQKIFLINCLVSIQQPLSENGIENEYITSLSSKIEGYISGLVEEEVVAILERCKLQKKISNIRERLQKYKTSEIVAKEDDADEEKPLAQLEDMGPPAVAESVRMLVSLVIGSEGVVPEFQQLQNPHIRSEASTGVAKSLAQAYEALYTALLDPVNGYSDPKSMLRHSPDQIKTMLGI
ncbi:hypothetical protein L7F22_054451 [Adiantum nelumboides]|nr:hypothetical protein [Adiantum nelumboides]